MPIQLLNLAKKHGIAVEYWKFTPPLEAIYVFREGLPPVIGLSQDLLWNHRRLRCVLAEEIGHHFTATGYAIAQYHLKYSDRISISRTEHKALRWAAMYLIPTRKLLRALANGVYSIEELADLFNVTEEMLEFRLNLLGLQEHRIKGGR